MFIKAFIVLTATFISACFIISVSVMPTTERYDIQMKRNDIFSKSIIKYHRKKSVNAKRNKEATEHFEAGRKEGFDDGKKSCESAHAKLIEAKAIELIDNKKLKN